MTCSSNASTISGHPLRAIHLPNSVDFNHFISQSIQRQKAVGDGNGWSTDVEHVFGNSPLSSPGPSPPPSPIPASAPSTSPPIASPNSSQLPAQKNRQKKHSHANRRRKRQEARNVTPLEAVVPKRHTLKKHVQGSNPIRTAMKGEDIRIATTGYVGIRERKKSSRVYTLEELVGKDSRFHFDLQEWDGRTAIPLVDSAGRIIAVLVGRPGGASWDMVHADAARLIDEARGLCTFSANQKRHRRGRHPGLAFGLSHGGGQPQPGLLQHSKQNEPVLSSLMSEAPIARIAEFASDAFATWAPKLYKYYAEHLNSLLAHYPNLTRNFRNSVWAAATINFGPQTTCFRHYDDGNLPFGLCAITSLGCFDPKKGGHLVLWDCRLVVEFPPGSTVLIPSAAVAHSNVSIAKGETRFSFTQYTAGSIFRWVDHGFQMEDDFKMGLSADEAAAEEAKQAVQLEMGLLLFSSFDELTEPGRRL